MTVKDIVRAVIIIAFILLSGISLNLYNLNKAKTKHIKALIETVSTKDTEIGTLTFKSKEFISYVDGLNTAHKIKIDSLLKSQKIKAKSVEKIQTISTNIVDVDTIKSLLISETIKNDSIYRIEILNVRECTKIKGYIESKDKNSSVYITNVETKTVTYIINYKKKTFWDIIFFRKGSLVKTKVTECGDSKYEELLVE